MIAPAIFLALVVLVLGFFAGGLVASAVHRYFQRTEVKKGIGSDRFRVPRK